MNEIYFKGLYLPNGATAEEKIKILADHIGELETRLEIVLEAINTKLLAVSENVSE